jgi:alkylhydroperoxidase family enzyme
MRLDKPRVEPLDVGALDPELRERFAAGGVGKGRVLNIFRTLAHHPKLLTRWLVFGNHVLAKSSLPARERELVILRIGWLCRAGYEWGQHVLIGRASGLSDAEIERIADGPDAAGWSDFDRTLLRATDELWEDAFVSDETWRALARRYSIEQLMDLVFTVGQYNLVSMALNSFGVQPDEGLPALPVR